MALMLRHLTLTDLRIWNPFGPNFSLRHVDKNFICVENLEFDDKGFRRWRAQVWIFVLNESRKRLIRLRVDCTKHLGIFMLKILQKKCM